MRISLIAAVAKNGAIGKGGAIPWNLPEDRAYFREKTLGHTVVMGRGTFESIGKPLPGRRCIVLSRTPGLCAPGALVLGGVSELLSLPAGAREEVFIIGGGAVYEAFLPLADTLYLTLVEAEPPGDRFFPPFPEAAWQEASRRPRVEPASNLRYAFTVYVRKSPRDGP